MQQHNTNFGHAVTSFCFNTKLQALSEWAPPDKIFIITDEHIIAHHGHLLHGWKVIVIPAGESSKSLDTLDYIIKQLLKMDAGRDAWIVGVGGGVVTDISGFVAGIYKRGVACGLVPTSILAMVDAAVGGKNGLDAGLYKNMIGLIRQPRFLLYDYSLLLSLPDEEWVNGFAEVIKHAAIGDKEMFILLQENSLKAFREDKDLLDKLIRRNVLFKAAIVQRDEQEKGERKLLNFGHTLGHAIENRYNLPHGHAVSIGMIGACRISERELGFQETDLLAQLLVQYQLPVAFDFDKEEALENMAADKKKADGRISYVLLKQLGNAVTHPMSVNEIKESL